MGLLYNRVEMNGVILQVDGATRRNPGPAAIAAIIKDQKGRTITTVSRRIGISTNNSAEYRAVIFGLERAIALGAKFVEVFSDSELIVKQVHGRYHVRTTSLLPLYQQVKQLLDSLDGFIINHIPRQYNNEAHQLAHRTLDLVRHIGYAPRCQLIIKLKLTNDEASDIAYLHKLISLLREFPGQDEVNFSVGSKDKNISLKLSNIYVSYCHELRTELKDILGGRQLIVKRLE